MTDRAATFLFADIAGFTALTEAHGDEAAIELVVAFSEAVEAQLPPVAGEHVKTIGDAVMLRVPEPADAVRLGLWIAHDAMRDHGSPAVRVGLHHGQAIERNGDYFGASVNLAARVSSAAAGGEVLVTGADRSAGAGSRRCDLRVAGAQEPPECERADRSFRGAQDRRARDGESPDRPGLSDGGRPRTRTGAAHVRGHGVLLLLDHMCGNVRAEPRAFRNLST